MPKSKKQNLARKIPKKKYNYPKEESEKENIENEEQNKSKKQ